MKNWEITKVCEPDHVLNKVCLEMAQPLGIINFGVGCGINSRIARQITQRLCPVSVGAYNPRVSQDLLYGASYYNKIVVLNSKHSADGSVRELVVKGLREAGLKTLVAFYVEGKMTSTRSMTSDIRVTDHDRKIRDIEQSQPLSLKPLVDYFITVPEEEGLADD